MTFTDQLIKIAEPYIQAEVKKPFLLEMLDGTLPLEKFKYYIKVDYPYLFDFSHILAIGIYKADDLETMKLMVSLLDANMREMGLHESYVKKFGISSKELTAQQMGPVKYSYTRHELATGQRGLGGELLAVLMPCMWGYAEIARRLTKIKKVDPKNPYKDWFDFYTSKDYVNEGKECIKLIDSLVSEYSQAQRKRIEEGFIRSCYFEVACWDAYYSQENWKI
jgi:thiaminase/transcriptional activator TenA